MGWPPLTWVAATLLLQCREAVRVDEDEPQKHITRPDVLRLRCLKLKSGSPPQPCGKETFTFASVGGKEYATTLVKGVTVAHSANHENDENELAALWKFCGSLSADGKRCCEPGADQECGAEVLSKTSFTKCVGRHCADSLFGVPLPYLREPAKIMEFIFKERYYGKRFVLSPASRYQPREEPVQNACKHYVKRVRLLIRRLGLELLMRWDPRGYFDVFDQFNSNQYYGPSLQVAVLSVLFGLRIKDEAQANEMWQTLINRSSPHALIDGSAPDYDDRKAWWESQLDEMLSGVYGTLRELEAEAKVIQSIEMSRGVKARRHSLGLQSVSMVTTAILGGVAIASTGGAAALPIAVAALGTKAIVSGIGLHHTVSKRKSADMFGQTHKQLNWIEYMRDWMETWLEKDISDAFQTSRPRLAVKESVKKKLICSEDEAMRIINLPTKGLNFFTANKNSLKRSLLERSTKFTKSRLKFSRSSRSPNVNRDCILHGENAEIELKAILLASFVNLVMIDGGCVKPPDLESEFEGNSMTVVGRPSDHVCCAKKTNFGKRSTCQVQRAVPRGRSCGPGWKQVTDDMAFADIEATMTDDLEIEDKVACCGIFQKAPTGEFPCQIAECSGRLQIDDLPLEDEEAEDTTAKTTLPWSYVRDGRFPGDIRPAKKYQGSSFAKEFWSDGSDGVFADGIATNALRDCQVVCEAETSCVGIALYVDANASQCRLTKTQEYIVGTANLREAQAPENWKIYQVQRNEESGWQGHCSNVGWQDDDEVRQIYCSTRSDLCAKARAHSLCKTHRHFCGFYGRQKHSTNLFLRKSVQRCLDQLKEAEQQKRANDAFANVGNAIQGIS
eukprot:TRINITY_DN22949_c0_g1_i1.p1 TRINITY_DN22949_c0_g1~~TRINITY_DN22949_c0_g1_i1.p1  ORF type:complete len:845 (+),score=126.48 TRINITY_DN22949_c0_g1_i1:62-2596(+)